MVRFTSKTLVALSVIVFDFLLFAKSDLMLNRYIQKFNGDQKGIKARLFSFF